jgi:hypothetical protein
MENRILDVEIRDGAIAPPAAEVWVRAHVPEVTPTTELRGRLVGPRCCFASTVEVAYPLRPLPAAPEGFAPPFGRVVIPEASLWDPQSPFLYEGPIELWQDGRLQHRMTVSHGLRTLTLGPRGLFVNGRRLLLRGRFVDALTEAEALTFRAAGANLLVIPVSAATRPLWELADRVGFLVLGEVRTLDAGATSALAALTKAAHASCLGWLVRSDYLGPLPGSHVVGVLADRRPEAPLPPGVTFVAGNAGLADLGLPLLIRGTAAPHVPGVFGTFSD